MNLNLRLYSLHSLGWPSDRDRDRDRDYRDARDARAPGGGGARGNERPEFLGGGRPSSRDRERERDRDRRGDWPDRPGPGAPDIRRAGGDRGFPPRYLCYLFVYSMYYFTRVDSSNCHAYIIIGTVFYSSVALWCINVIHIMIAFG